MILIVFISAFNVIASTVMLIVEKENDIQLSHSDLVKIFISEELSSDLINEFIWLNFIDNENTFFTKSENKFSRFNKVKVVDIMKFQNIKLQ